MRGPRMMLQGGFLALVLGLLVGVLPAQTEVVLKSGKVVPGRIVHDDGSEVEVRIKTGGPGKAIATFKYEELAPKTIYRLRTSTKCAKRLMKIWGWTRLRRFRFRQKRVSTLKMSLSESSRNCLRPKVTRTRR